MSVRLVDWQTSRDGRITVAMTWDDGAPDDDGDGELVGDVSPQPSGDRRVTA